MNQKKRFQIRISGIVQGVGFRPFIYRIANHLNLKGIVQNRSDCVVIEIECNRKNLEKFLNLISSNSPPASKITDIKLKELPIKGYNDFKIVKSKKTTEQYIFIPPDIATCDDCLKELFNPSDRRYLYPFINCTNCGPRLTIIKDIPYDRKNTSMSKFKMCNSCKLEYENPEDRRFHAEPIACNNCGPQLTLHPELSLNIPSNEIIKKISQLLKNGKIIAIKGLGGFHLAVDATNFKAVENLRKRKIRDDKPFALMVKDINSAKKIAYISEIEEKYLKSHISPIILLKKKKNRIIAQNVAPNLDNYGIMLPYTPLHHLLFQYIDFLVMTSANISDEPICIENNEAIERLKNIADYFLLHNRDILVRCDDSIISIFNNTPVTFRFSRGFSPSPLVLNRSYPEILALGGHMKNSICILKDKYAFISPHVGDLDTPLAREFFSETIQTMKRITKTEPEIIAIDMHPEYYSSNYALTKLKNKKIIEIQHHHAHIVSCMAENNINGKVIGIACDGTGFGKDGKIWGGEIFIVDEKEFKRIGHLKYFKLIGGEKAIKEIWRTGLYFLYTLNRNFKSINVENNKINITIKMLEKNFNVIECSSLGRLFDACASIIGIRQIACYEGQAAMELEAVASKCNKKVEKFPDPTDNYNIDSYKIVENVIKMMENNLDISQIALSFHFAIIDAFVKICKKIRKDYNLNRVVLSGGCFQNKILTENMIKNLKKEKFIVYFHSKIPPNDGGISLGQAIIAGNNL